MKRDEDTGKAFLVNRLFTSDTHLDYFKRQHLEVMFYLKYLKLLK